MNLKEEILKEHSKAQAIKISEYIGNDQSRFDELMELFFNDEYRVIQRTAWVLSHCTDKYPFLANPHLDKLVENLKSENLHVAVHRNTVRMLAGIDIPERLQGVLLELCFDYLLSPKTPIAVQAHSMQVIYNISQNEPDLLNELKMVIEERLPYGSAGFKSKGKKLIKAINKKTKS